MGQLLHRDGWAAAVLAGLIFVGMSINLHKWLAKTVISRGTWGAFIIA
jgi:hypothetical protein